MPPMMGSPPGGQPGTPIGATPAQRPPMQGQPQQGGAPGGQQLDPNAIKALAQALNPQNFKTFMQIFGAVMLDTYQLIQKSAQGGGPQGQPQPGQAPQGQPPQRPGMMGPPQGGQPPGGPMGGM